MLKDSFFFIRHVSFIEGESKDGSQQDRYLVSVSINPGHDIFSGHFPGNPVVPGVCHIRMITESVSEILKREVRLVEADNVKFITPMIPFVTDDIDIQITLKKSNPETVSCNAMIVSGNITFFKYKAVFLLL